MPNAYIEFVKSHREAIAKKHPNAKPTEVMKLVAAEYRKKTGTKKVMKGKGKSVDEILKEQSFSVKGDPNNLVGKIAPDGVSLWYKYDVPGKMPGTFAAAPGKHILDNVNNLYTKDGKIFINTRFNSPMMKNVAGLGGPLMNYKNPGKLGFFEAIPKAAFDGDNYKVAKQYWDKYIAPAAGIVLNPLASIIGKKAGDALNDAFNNDLNELFPEEKKAGSGARSRKIKLGKVPRS